jgi:hypothetical protein
VCRSLSLSLSFSFCLHAREHIVIKKGKNNHGRKDKSTCINSGAAEAMAALMRRNTAKHGIPQMHSLQKERDGEISPKIEKFSDLGVFQSPDFFYAWFVCVFFFPSL